MIEVSGLTVRFGGATPLDGMDVKFEAGTCGLIGPNGAGKTTFFNVLSGFVRPAAGSIEAFGENLLKMADFRRAHWGVRRTFQNEQAIEELSVYDNVAMAHEQAGKSSLVLALGGVLETQATGARRRPGRRPRSHGYWLYAGGVPCLHVADRRSYLTHAAWMGLNVPREPPGAGSVDHIAFNASDYESVVARLDQRGIRAVHNTVPGGGPCQLFVQDPNGVRVEINVKTLTEAR